MAGELIPLPVLDGRDEELIAALAVARVSGGLTPERVERNIAVQRELLALLAAGGELQPVCPELTNANPASPHTVLIEAFAWMLGLQSYKLNQVPDQNRIEFARLFGIELREATRASTTLRFTVNPPAGVDAVIPAGTEVASEDGSVVFGTVEELVIPDGTASGDVAALRTVAGATMLAPGRLTSMVDAVAWVGGVTNPDAIESGTDKESVESALARARNFQRRGLRLVSAQDMEDAIREEALGGLGVVKAFPFVMAGDFSENRAGHTTVIVMTSTGGAVSAEVKARINSLLKQLVGSQFVYVLDPVFSNFSVAADVRLTSLVSQTATLAAVEKSLRDFYAASNAHFGRPVLRSEIIALVEGTPGVDRIVAQPGGDILASPLVDISLAPYELPRLVNVTVNVVP
ncbi:MAG TPA: baseplate J/gp47 family protein [Pyrinomonadaceae bacterium]|nr:baseplate J/gp47 family protein [Pyrinomonadaceae bacterium]